MLARHFSSSYIKAVLELYPNIGLDEAKFNRAPSMSSRVFRCLLNYLLANYWTKANIKKFFNNFANARNFDPRDPSNWYQFTYRDITQSEVRLGYISGEQ